MRDARYGLSLRAALGLALQRPCKAVFDREAGGGNATSTVVRTHSRSRPHGMRVMLLPYAAQDGTQAIERRQGFPAPFPRPMTPVSQ
jgi:hypothetical protein